MAYSRAVALERFFDLLFPARWIPYFTTRSSATGLGLPIVRRITDAHGGEVVAESALDAGTTVGLLLPEPSTTAAAPERRRRRSLRRGQTAQ
jgi:signal transduction histidine kinase